VRGVVRVCSSDKKKNTCSYLAYVIEKSRSHVNESIHDINSDSNIVYNNILWQGELIMLEETCNGIFFFCSN
jgi:hypothetical protein